jgi:hypothetical protein
VFRSSVGHFQTICSSLIIKYMNLQEIKCTHLFYFFGSYPKIDKLCGFKNACFFGRALYNISIPCC